MSITVGDLFILRAGSDPSRQYGIGSVYFLLHRCENGSELIVRVPMSLRRGTIMTFLLADGEESPSSGGTLVREADLSNPAYCLVELLRFCWNIIREDPLGFRKGHGNATFVEKLENRVFSKAESLCCEVALPSNDAIRQFGMIRLFLAYVWGLPTVLQEMEAYQMVRSVVHRACHEMRLDSMRKVPLDAGQC